MICANIENIKENINIIAVKAGRSPKEITLVAVSKRHPVESIQEAIDCGQKNFGENYIQEMLDKKEVLGASADFHFIGNLQSNKAKFAARCCSVVETIDRIKIAKTLNNHLRDLNKNLGVLIQVNIGHESQKSGTEEEKVAELIREVQQLPQLNILGLMTIPPFHDNPEESRPYFKKLRKLSESLINEGTLSQAQNALSMGMSNDYHVAIEEGATIVRVGTSIFGTRPA